MGAVAGGIRVSSVIKIQHVGKKKLLLVKEKKEKRKRKKIFQYSFGVILSKFQQENWPHVVLVSAEYCQATVFSGIPSTACIGFSRDSIEGLTDLN